MRIPVTVADQGVFVGPDEADELVDLLTDAAAVIGVGDHHGAVAAGLAQQPAVCHLLVASLGLRAGHRGGAAALGRVKPRFRPENFVATVIWQKAYSPRNDAPALSTDQDYILVYSNAPDWRSNRLAQVAERDALYKAPDGDPQP